MHQISSVKDNSSDMASVGVTAPTESIKPSTMGDNYDLDDAIVAGTLIHGEVTDPPTN